MSVIGSCEVTVSSDGLLSAAVSMNDDRFELVANTKGQLYGIRWHYARNKTKEIISETPEFELGHASSAIFDNGILPIEFVAFARTRRTEWRPVRLDRFREIEPHFILPPISQAFIDQLSVAPNTAVEADEKPIWLEPVLHQMMG